MKLAKPKAEKFYLEYLLVTVRGSFPIDMLRYDGCCPNREEDSRRIQDNGLRTIQLRRYGRSPFGQSRARWESFGVTVEVVLP